MAEVADDLRVGDIGVEAWDGKRMHTVYMRFGKRTDMLLLDWEAVASAIGIQHGSEIQRMIVNEYMGPIGSGGRLASGGWRTLATWLLSEQYMVWNSTEDWKGTRNYERDIKRLYSVGWL